MLLDKLKEKQQTLGLNDDQFAAQLGISAAMWSYIKHDKRQMGDRTLKGICRRFPDLSPHVTLFLSSN